MRLNEVLGTPLPKYSGSIQSWDNWVELRDSGTWNPTYVGGDFMCTDSHIPELIGAPRYIKGNFFCSNTGLRTLKGVPEHIGENFFCNNNELTSLKNVHKQIKILNGTFHLVANPITSSILGLLLISDLDMVNNKHPAFQIINLHLNKDKDILECQEELISAGYKEFAKL